MITGIRLQNFRSYKDGSFDIGPGVNIIVGPNASGKTNLLEAILVASRGSSYRAKDIELIKFDSTWSRVDVDTNKGVRTIKISIEPTPLKTYEVNNQTHKRLSTQNTIPVVLFEPNHLLMLGGKPELRRNYLDDLLEQTTPGYSDLRRRYKRALAQRNSLLKRNQTNHEQIFLWNVRLSELAGKIVRHRADLTNIINQKSPAIYKKLSRSNTQIEVVYTNNFPIESYETNLLKKLEENLEIDKQRGFTTKGPHREDIVVHINGQPLQTSASRGEARTMVLALKIIELFLIEETLGKPPILLLDDVFSELDGARRRALTDYLDKYQTFITTTDADAVINHFNNSNIIPIQPL